MRLYLNLTSGWTRQASRYEIIIYWSEEDNAFIAEVPELPGCMAHGKNYEEAVKNVKDAVYIWIKTADEIMPYMTIFERKGMEKGMDIGVDIGAVKTLKNTLISMIKVRFGDVSSDIERKINEASKEQLEKWIINFVNSRTIDEIFEEN